jgi:endonuclease YncB( thermonuclease family)
MIKELLIVMVLSVHDGDTLTVNLPCALPIACEKMPIRIFGIDTPEITDQRPDVKLLAVKARDRVRELTGFSHKVELSIEGRDMYYRLDADVYSDGVSVADTLKSEGLARPYFGKGPKPW